jgi:hypothetical protein
LERCLEVLDDSPLDAWSAAATAFDGPLTRCIRRASELELADLDRATRQFLDHCGDDCERLRFVVCAGHQPRYRQLTRQYFAKLVGEPHDSTGPEEVRVVYAENRTEDEAIELLAAMQVDRQLAARIWGESSRMQKDVLGEAAEDALHDFEVPDLARPAGGS